MNHLSGRSLECAEPQTSSGVTSLTPTQGAFTRADLIAVLAILAVLSVLFLSTRARAAAGSSAAICQGNVEQLGRAWSLYANDHSGWLVYNLSIPEIEATVAAKKNVNWANNVMSWGTSYLVTNGQATGLSALSAYLPPDPSVFQCPDDTNVSFQQFNKGWTRRARTYSMNGSLGSPFARPAANGNAAKGISEWCPERRQFLNLSTISQPSGIFVFLEEHPDSINDGLYILGCRQYNQWSDLPASFHGGACSFSFADGHVELHPWENDLTKQPVRMQSLMATSIPSTKREDYEWVLDRTAVSPSQLAIRQPASNQIQITWSQLPTNYVIQVSDQLSSGWTNSGVTSEQSLGQSAVRVPVEGGHRFFRLSR